MACLIGAAMCGAGLGIVFNCNGSTGGTDIIAAIIHNYKDVTVSYTHLDRCTTNSKKPLRSMRDGEEKDAWWTSWTAMTKR